MTRPGLLLVLCVCAGASLADGKASKRGKEPTRPPRYNLLLAGQCQVNGMALLDGAMWSPQPCSVCQCQNGKVKCGPLPCAGTSEREDANKGTNRVPEQRHIVRGGERSNKLSAARQAAKKKDIRLLEKTRPTARTVRPAPAGTKQGVLDKAPRPPAARVHASSMKAPRDSYPASDEDDYDNDDDFVGPPPVRPATRTTPRPAAAQTRKPVPAPHVAGRPVVTFPQRTTFIESLPSGCLLAESLVACGGTGMANMPIITDPGVKTLYLADNRISKIPAKALAGLPNLEWLDLSKNRLDDTSFSVNIFQNLTKLRRLMLDSNNLTKVPAFLPPSLVELKINDNKLSGLTPGSFKGLSKLLTLELEDNRFHDGNVSPLTFRPLKKLTYLRLEDNKFRAIPSGLPASLQELHLSDNKIEVVHAALNRTVNLRVLDLSHNRIREDRIAPRAWIHLMKLESLDLSHNKLVHMPSFLPSGLRQLTMHHNQVKLIPGFVFGHMRPGLDLLHLSHNQLGDDGINEVSFLGLFSSLSELLLDHNRLLSIPRGLLQLKNLQHLRLNHNLISSIPMNTLCDAMASDDSPLVSVHLEHNLIQRHRIPPTAFSCIQNYQAVLLRPQSYEDQE